MPLIEAQYASEDGGRMAGIYETLGALPRLKRGLVWCPTCGRHERVNSAECLRSGWPECCGYTMTIDSPHEQRKRAAQHAAEAWVGDREGK